MILVCPRCGCENLHQKQAKVWFRSEDAYDGLYADISKELHVLFQGRIEETKNPSPRRSGLAIRFGCERCDMQDFLNIYQHKGDTILEWDLDGKKADPKFGEQPA